jgi:predicted nucleic acid-binding protein
VADIVLDEDVFVFAISSESTNDPEDKAAAAFLKCLQEHHRWVLSVDIVRAYRRQLGRHAGRNGGVASELVASLEGVLHSERFLWKHHPPAVSGDYDLDDMHVVATAAASAPSVLVTSDQRLTDKLIEGDIANSNGFRVFNPFEALGELCESSG